MPPLSFAEQVAIAWVQANGDRTPFQDKEGAFTLAEHVAHIVRCVGAKHVPAIESATDAIARSAGLEPPAEPDPVPAQPKQPPKAPAGGVAAIAPSRHVSWHLARQLRPRIANKTAVGKAAQRIQRSAAVTRALLCVSAAFQAGLAAFPPHADSSRPKTATAGAECAGTPAPSVRPAGVRAGSDGSP